MAPFCSQRQLALFMAAMTHETHQEKAIKVALQNMAYPNIEALSS